MVWSDFKFSLPGLVIRMFFGCFFSLLKMTRVRRCELFIERLFQIHKAWQRLLITGSKGLMKEAEFFCVDVLT